VYSNTASTVGAQSAAAGAIGSTTSQGYAYNLSTGAATGSASSAGSAAQGASGNVGTAQLGNVGVNWGSWTLQPGTNTVISAGTGAGSESSGTQDSITAGTNAGAAVGATSGGNFGTQVGYTTTSTAVPLSDGTAPNSQQTINLTAGTNGGTYSTTSTVNGVYLNGNNIDFGGNSNTLSLVGDNAPVQNSASGAYTANASIDGAVATGNQAPVSVTIPVSPF
jgi:hypothetical protein